MLPVGRISGHRGKQGELTVRVRGEAAAWVGLSRIRVDLDGTERTFVVESSRAYRDRLVLKLEGLDDGNAAARLRGGLVLVARGDAPAPQEGEYYLAELVGLVVVDADGQRLGRVEEVITTGGTEVLCVRGSADPAVPEGGQGPELLVPLAREFVRSVDLDAGRIEVEVPAELRELNRRG
jgi:16S rRNA processing protein RimM